MIEVFIILFIPTIIVTIIIYFIGTRFINKQKVGNKAINIGLLIALLIAFVVTLLLGGTDQELATENAWIAGLIGTTITLISISLKGRPKEIEANGDAHTSKNINGVEKENSSEIVYCKNCGKKIKNTDKFCQYCGEETSK